MVFLHRTLQLRFREGNGQEAEAWLVTYKGRTMASILHVKEININREVSWGSSGTALEDICAPVGGVRAALSP